MTGEISFVNKAHGWELALFAPGHRHIKSQYFQLKSGAVSTARRLLELNGVNEIRVWDIRHDAFETWQAEKRPEPVDADPSLD